MSQYLWSCNRFFNHPSLHYHFDNRVPWHMDQTTLGREKKTLLLSPTSSQNSGSHEKKVSFSQSAPSSPRHHTLTNSPSQGKGILLQPAEYGPNSRRSSTDESRKSLQFDVPVDVSRFVTSSRNGYQPSDWSLLSIDRHGPRQKYIITLLYWPLTTLYTWPLDPKSPFGQGLCFITATGRSNTSSSNADVIKMSVTVLEDTVRTWMRQGRPHRVNETGAHEVQYADIVRVCERLKLKPASEEQRNDYLQFQHIPDLPSSLPSSRASTPGGSPSV